jgi:hypothetical protein
VFGWGRCDGGTVRCLGRRVGESTSNLVACRIGEDVNVDDGGAVLLGEDGIICGDTAVVVVLVLVVPMADGGGVETLRAVRFCAGSNGVVFFSDFLAEIVPLLFDPFVAI